MHNATYRLHLPLLFRVEGNFNSPASPVRSGGGTGAGWYTRLTAAKAIEDIGYLLSRLMQVILRLNAESSSRPRTPSPLLEGGGGAKITFVSETQ